MIKNPVSTAIILFALLVQFLWMSVKFNEVIDRLEEVQREVDLVRILFQVKQRNLEKKEFKS